MLERSTAAALSLRQDRLEEAIRYAELGGQCARELNDRFTLAKNDWVWGYDPISEWNKEPSVPTVYAA